MKGGGVYSTRQNVKGIAISSEEIKGIVYQFNEQGKMNFLEAATEE